MDDHINFSLIHGNGHLTHCFRTYANLLQLGFGAGMGLPNMKKYSDEMKIETEIGVGTTITMVVNI